MEKTEKFKKISKSNVKANIGTGSIPGDNKWSSLFIGGSDANAVNYNISPWLIYNYAQEEPFIRAAINKKATKVMAEGYSLDPIDDSPEAEREIEIFEEFAKTAGGRYEDSGKQINFDGVLMNTFLTVFEADDFHWEIRNNNEGIPGEINVLDWETMRVHLENKKGKIKNWIQTIGGVIAATWEPEEIIHRSIYNKGTAIYGNSLVSTVMRAAANRMFAMKYAGDIFLNQKPKGIWGFDVSDEEYKKLKDQIKEAKQNPHADIAIQTKDGKFSYQNIGIKTEMEYKDFILEMRKEILVGMGVPPGSIYLSGESSGWDADTQLHEFDEDINRIRNWMEGIINETLFPRFGFKHIKFTFNRSNKRDQLKEAQIAGVHTASILTINERREMLGFKPIEDGDKIVTQVSNAFGNQGNQDNQNDMSDNNPKADKDKPDIEGETAGEKELSKSVTIIKDVKYKNPNYFRKSYGGIGMFNKSIIKTKTNPKKLANKRKPIINRITKNYSNSLFKILNEFIGEIKKSVEFIDTNSFFNKIFRRKFNKINDPKKTFDVINEIKTSYLNKGKEVGNEFAKRSYDYGIDAAEIETGLEFSKVSLSPETLDFLKSFNVDLVEGALSEVAQRSATQIRLGVEAGESIPQIAKRLDTVVEKTYKNRLKTIARTEVMRATNKGSLEAYKNSNIISKVQVLIGSGPDDANICGETYGGVPGGLSKEWNKNEVPSLPAHSNCRCVILPVVE